MTDEPATIRTSEPAPLPESTMLRNLYVVTTAQTVFVVQADAAIDADNAVAEFTKSKTTGVGQIADVAMSRDGYVVLDRLAFRVGNTAILGVLGDAGAYRR